MVDSTSGRKKRFEEMTRQLILESARTVARTEGLEKLTMDKVAAQAELAKGTLYYYFKSKKELLGELVRYVFSPLGDSYKEVQKLDLTPLEKLEKYLFDSIDFARTHTVLLNQLGPILFDDYYGEIIDKSSWYWEMTEVFEETIKEGMEQGLIRKSVNYKLMAVMFIGSMNTMMKDNFIFMPDISAKEQAKEAMSIFTHGVST